MRLVRAVGQLQRLHAVDHKSKVTSLNSAFLIEGILLVFGASAVNSTVVLALSNNNTLFAQEISNHSTWRDAGSALGILLGSLILDVSDADLLFILLTVFLVVSYIDFRFSFA
jgi:predicted branched-subunit amino acid permease